MAWPNLIPLDKWDCAAVGIVDNKAAENMYLADKFGKAAASKMFHDIQSVVEGKKQAMKIIPNESQITFMPTETIHEEGIAEGKIIEIGQAVDSSRFKIGSIILYHLKAAYNFSTFSLVNRDSVLAILEY